MTKNKKFTLDDFGFDKEMDFDDSDFELTPPKDDRSPVTKATSGFFKGAKDTAFSNQFVKKFIKTTLPKGYGDALEMTGEGLGEASKLYNSTAKEIKPVIKEAKKVASRALPHLEGKVPKGLAEKLKKWAASSEESSASSQDYRESGIASQIGEIFAEQMKEASKTSQQSEVKDAIKENIDKKRHSDIFEQLEGIRLSTARLSTYQDKVTIGFQRKSLELQYRQYYIASDMLEEQKKANEQFKTNLAEIVKNTGLPEYSKIQNSERLGDMMRNKFMSNIYDTIFDKRRGYVGKVVNRLGTKIKDKVTGFASNVQDGLATADMVLDANESMKEFGGGIDPYEMGGSIVGGAAMDSIGTRVGKKLGTALNKSRFGKQIRTTGNNLEYGVKNISQIGDKFSRGDYDYDEGLAGKIISTVSKLPGGGAALDALKEAAFSGRPDQSFGMDNIKDLQGVAIFTNQTRKSITEVIPGFLSRIYQELQIIRTGDDKIGLTEYDYTGNKFTSSKALMGSLLSKIVDKDQTKRFNEDNEEIINQVDPEGKLNKKERAELGKFFLSDNFKNGLGDPKRFTDPSQFRNVSSATAKKAAELFKTSFGVDDYGGVENKEAFSAKRIKFSNSYGNLGNNFGDSRNSIQQILNLGNYDAIRELGLMNEKGEFNQDQLASYMAGANLPNQSSQGKSGKVGKFNSVQSSNDNIANNGWNNSESTSVDYTDNLKEILKAIKDSNTVEFNKTSAETTTRIEKILLEGQIGSEARTSGNAENKRWYQASIGDIIGSISSGVSTGLSFAGDQLQKGAKGLTKLGSNLIGFGFDKAKKGADWLIKKRDEFCDIYIKGEVTPRIQAWRLRAGHYYDAKTGEVIRKISDIKGNIVDRDGNIILSFEDMKNIIPPDVRSNLKKVFDGLISAGKKGISATQDFYGTAFSVAKTTFKVAKEQIMKVLAKDVYVVGEEEPRLLAITMRVGGYRSKITGKTIWRPLQIDGPVLNTDGEVVLSDADLRKGIVDKEGKPFKSIISKIFNFGKDAVKKAFSTLKNSAKWTVGKAKDSADIAMNILKNGISVIGQGEVINRLTEIRDLLKARLPEKKKIAGDTDGDGDRENSWQDNAQKRANAQKAAKEDGKSGIGKGKTAGAALLGNKKDDEEDEDDDSDWDISDIHDGWDMAKGAGRRMKRWGGKAIGKGRKLLGRRGAGKGLLKGAGGFLKGAGKTAAKGVGKIGLKGLGAAGAAYGAYSAYDNFKQGNYGEAAIDAGLSAGGLALTGAAGAGAAGVAGGVLAGIGTALGTAAAGIAGILSAPVVLGALAIGGIGYLAYRYYKTKRLDNLSTYRFAQYGFTAKDTDALQKVFGLEDKLMPSVEYKKDGAKLKNNVLLKDLLEFFDINVSNRKMVVRFTEWYQYRFKPVFLTHLSVLKNIAPSVSLDDVDSKLKPEEKKKYFDATKFPNGPYNVLSSPIEKIEKLTVGQMDVEKSARICEEALKKEQTEKKSTTGMDTGKTVVATATAATVMTDGKPKANETSNGFASVPPKQNSEMNKLQSSLENSNKSISQVLYSSTENVRVESDEKQINPLNSIRFRTYGLYDLETFKINGLLSLERVVLDQIKFNGNDIEWNGNIDEVIRRCGFNFGVTSYNSRAGEQFAVWFNSRFLPVFSNYVGTIYGLTGKKDIEGMAQLLKPSHLFAVANAVYTSKCSFNGKSGVSVWTVSVSPWAGYSINTNDATVNDSINALSEKASNDISVEKIPSKKADEKTQSVISTDKTKEQAKSNVSFWDTSKNLLNKAGSWVADNAKTAWNATKNAVAAVGSGIANTASKATSAAKEYASSAYNATGTAIAKVGEGIGGMVSQIPMPTASGTYAALKETISAASKMVGVDEKLMAVMAAIESGFKYDVKASTSSATGLFQFIKSTWEYMVKNYGAKYGIGMDASPKDPRANAIMGAEFLKMNMSKLAPSIGRQPTYTDMYLAHFMGDGGARQFLKAMSQNPNGIAASLFPKQAAANKTIFYNGGQPRTFQEIYNHFTNLIGSRAKSHKIDIGMGGGQVAANDPKAGATASGGVVPQGTNIAPGTDPKATGAVAGATAGPTATPAGSPTGSKTAEMIAADSKKGVSPTTSSTAPGIPESASPIQAGFNQAPRQVANQVNATKDDFNKSIGIVDKTLIESLEVHRASYKVLQDILTAISNGGIKIPNAASTESKGITTTGAKKEMPAAPISMKKQA